MRDFDSVHDAHCCPIHGCKYGNCYCPVEQGIEKGIPCEICDEQKDRIEAIAFLEKHADWLSKNWQLSPEGRQYEKQFRQAIKNLE